MAENQRYKKIELSKALNISRTTIHKHLSRPNAPQPDDAKTYDLAEVAEYIFTAQARDNNPVDLTITAAKLSGLNADTRLKQIKIDAMEGRLVSINEALSLIMEAFNGLTARLLSMPSALAPRLQKKKNIRETANILEQSIKTTINQYQSMIEARIKELQKKNNAEQAELGLFLEEAEPVEEKNKTLKTKKKVKKKVKRRQKP